MSIIQSPCLSCLIPNLILGSNLDHIQKTLAPTLVDPLTLQITCVPNGSENIDEPTHLRGSERIEQWHHRVVSATRLRTIFPTCSPNFPPKKNHHESSESFHFFYLLQISISLLQCHKRFSTNGSYGVAFGDPKNHQNLQKWKCTCCFIFEHCQKPILVWNKPGFHSKKNRTTMRVRVILCYG